MVVFIPPAVELGEPPINISRIITACEESVMDEISAVLNPAVLGVTDWKRESISLFPNGNSLKLQRKKSTAGRIIKRAVVVRMICFACGIFLYEIYVYRYRPR